MLARRHDWWLRPLRFRKRLQHLATSSWPAVTWAGLAADLPFKPTSRMRRSNRGFPHTQRMRVVITTAASHYEQLIRKARRCSARIVSAAIPFGAARPFTGRVGAGMVFSPCSQVRSADGIRAYHYDLPPNPAEFSDAAGAPHRKAWSAPASGGTHPTRESFTRGWKRWRAGPRRQAAARVMSRRSHSLTQWTCDRTREGNSA